VPTPAMQTAHGTCCQDPAAAAESWNELMKTQLANRNGDLQKSRIGAVGAVNLPVQACQ